MLAKLGSVKHTVELLLRKYPETRDNDRLLMLKVWAEQNPKLRFHGFNFVSFSHGFIDGSYADPESIRRARQKIQEQNAELRGVSHDNRRYLAEETRCHINNTTTYEYKNRMV